MLPPDARAHGSALYSPSKNTSFALFFLLFASLLRGQTLLDDFSDGNFSASPAWSGSTSNWTIVANSDAAAGSAGSQTLRLNAAAVSATDYLSSQIADWGDAQEWGFWVGRRSQALTASNQTQLWLYATESTLTSPSVDGYRIAIGDDSGNDDIRLEYIVDGALNTTIIASAGAITNGLTDFGFLLRITRSAAGEWTVFTSALPTANGTGATASNIPDATNANVNQNSATHAALTPAANGYVGLAAQHTTSANAIVGAEFDQIFFTPTTVSGPPVVASPTATAISENTATLGATVSSDGGASLAARGTALKTSSPLASTDNPLAEGGTAIGAFSHTRTGLLPETQYFFAGYASNANGTALSTEGNFRTLSNPPTAPAGSLSAIASGQTSMNMTWAVAGFPNSGATAAGYVLLRATSPNLPSLSNGNGAAPMAGASTSIVSSAISSAATSATATGLSANTGYNFLLIPYTWDGANSATYNYLTASAPTVYATTWATAPTASATGLAFSNVAMNSMTLSWTAAVGNPTGYLVLHSTGPSAPNTDPANGTAYALGATLGNATVAHVGSETSFSLSGLLDNTAQHAKIFPYNGSGAAIAYRTTAPLSGSQSTASVGAPTALAATNIGSASLTANWSTVAGATSYRLDASAYEAFGTPTNATDLFISEYVEGSSNNKYIEIFNGTGAPIDLSGYRLQAFANGSSAASSDVALSGTLAHGAAMVFKNSGAVAFSGMATTNSAVNFNGDDAVALFKTSSSSFVDIVGRIGEDPGTEWTAGSFSTLDKTLVRKSSVIGGITANPAAGFPTLATEWEVFSTDEVSKLGAHTYAGLAPSFLPGYENLAVVGTSQAITGLAQGTNYYYRARAVAPNSVSANSNTLATATCPTSVFYADADGDGYGNAAASSESCSLPAGHVANSNDCDDENFDINPSVSETCNLGDDNCNGQIDEGTQTVFYADNDGDGYGAAASTTLACSLPAGFSANDDDCNDMSASVHPAAIELCNNMDDNCDGTTDEDATPPTALCQNASVGLDGSGTNTNFATQLNNGSTDNCSQTSDLIFLATPASVGCPDLAAPITVALMVADQAGNTATCSAQITVVDVAPPTAVCQSIFLVLGADQTASLEATQLNDGSTDNCTPASNLAFSSSPNSFICNDLGENTITLTVSDAQNLSATCTATVTVFEAMYYTETGRRNAGDGLAGDKFGSGLALDGLVAAAGAPEDRVGTQNKQGSTYLFNGASGWSQIRQVAAPDGLAIDYFGISASLAEGRLLIGSYGDNVGPNNDQGSAYIFEKDMGGGDNWGFAKKLFDPSGLAYEYFGNAVSTKNNRALVGVHKAKIGANTAQGAAYLYEKDLGGAGNWGLAKKLVAPDGMASNLFGQAIGLADDLALVGASGNNSNRGAAYIFAQNQGGTNNWGLLKKLTANDPSTGDWFGASCSISSEYIIVGAPNKSTYRGAAYVFSKDTGGSNNWGFVKKLTAADGAVNDRFGTWVALNGDHAYIGATQHDGKGALYVFHKHAGGANNWGQIGKYMTAEAGPGDQFGFIAAADGSNLMVAANLDDVSGKINQGSFFSFESEACEGGGRPGAIARSEDSFSSTMSLPQITCAPNPFADVLHLYVSTASPARLQVFNATGSIISTVTVPVGEKVRLDLNIEHSPSGIYIVRIFNKSGQQSVRAIQIK